MILLKLTIIIIKRLSPSKHSIDTPKILLLNGHYCLQGGTLALLQQEPEESITRLERRLYFQTAHGHFKAGCPALALEVLSKLPARVRDEKPRQPVSAPSVDDAGIHTGQLGEKAPEKSKNCKLQLLLSV